MQNTENYSNQRTKIAEKSKWTALTFIAGFVICVAVACVTMIAKPQFCILYFCLFVSMGVVFLGCGIYDIKRPKVVIETDGKILFVNSKEGWKQIEIADVIDVKKVRTVSGRTVLRRGRISISTKSETIVVYNVANVEDVYLKLLKLCALI